MLLDQGQIDQLVQARHDYGDGPYDEALKQVQHAAQKRGSIGKCDIGALMLWKRLNLSTKWAFALNSTPDREVREITSAAIESARDESSSVAEAGSTARDALRALPGCRSSGSHAVASAILTAGAPQRMSVYDTRAVKALERLGCEVLRGDFGRYMEAVCTIAAEVNDSRGSGWLPRDVDQALFMLGK